MARDNASIKHTCPMIDDVIHFIAHIDFPFENEDELKKI